MIRRALEEITRYWRFPRTLHVGGKSVRMWVTPAAGLKTLCWPLDRVDPLLIRLAQLYIRDGAVVWDVGANIGLFTFAASALAGPTGHVVAFEADPWLARFLTRTTPMGAPVSIINAAVCDFAGERAFAIARRARSSNHLVGYGSTQTGGIREVQTVRAMTLDDALSTCRGPTVLKIDVEGAELEVLRGAGRVLSHHPVIICEVAAAVSAEVTQLLHSHSYSLWDGETGQPIARATWSTVAV